MLLFFISVLEKFVKGKMSILEADLFPKHF